MPERLFKRNFEKGTITCVDGYDLPEAPEWADGSLTVVRKNHQVLEGGKEADEIWITTQEEDREGDTIVATGVRLDNYWKNPVLGWNHGMGSIDFPIGRVTDIETVAGVGLAARWVWPPWKFDNPKEGVEAVDDIHRLWNGRFINAASIWFRIIAADPKEGHENDWWPPLIIHESELLEAALVYVPANQSAVRRSMKAIGESEYLRRVQRKFRQKFGDNGERLTTVPRLAADVVKNPVRNVIVPVKQSALSKVEGPELVRLDEKLNQLNFVINNLKGSFKS
ncbi:MAG: hypothetical protein CV087_20855 [Candidatus Brocadia sp. WS118]|nr:MAG: hypothetical protein CV087_20855 [Candidatus Brocadia sp. WS118]